MRLRSGWSRFARCASGATAIEYGLLASLIAGVLVLSLAVLGSSVGAAFADAAAVLPGGAAASQPGGGPPPGAGNGNGNHGRGLGNGGPTP